MFAEVRQRGGCFAIPLLLRASHAYLLFRTCCLLANISCGNGSGLFSTGFTARLSAHCPSDRTRDKSALRSLLCTESVTRSLPEGDTEDTFWADGLPKLVISKLPATVHLGDPGVLQKALLLLNEPGIIKLPGTSWFTIRLWPDFGM